MRRLLLLLLAFPAQDDAAARVRQALLAGQADAEARLAAARREAAAEDREEREREARLERAMIEMTRRAPLRLKVSEEMTLEGVRVISYAAGLLRLAWPAGEVDFPVDQLPPESRATLLLGALSEATARDHFEVGKLLLRLGDYDRAVSCFERAKRKDSAFGPIAPDVEAVRRASRFFRGSFKASGSSLSLRWSFASEEELGDFAALRGEAAVLPGQGLATVGVRLALTLVRDIPFRDRVRVTALARESSDTAHLLGLRFLKPGGGEVIVYGALATSLKTFLVRKVEGDAEATLLAPTPGGTGNRMSLDFNGGRLSFKVGERTVWSGEEGGFTDVSVILGGVALGKGDVSTARASATFRDLTLFGGVNPQWMSKRTAGFRDAVAAETAREHLAGRAAAPEELARLSVDGLAAGLSGEAGAAWFTATTEIRKARKSRERLASAERALESLAALAPDFAPGLYWAGILRGWAGDRRGAAERLDRALAAFPDFPEALSARATLNALDGRWRRVEELVDLALELKPDLGEAWLLKARLRREAGEAAEAALDARTARRLSPLDPELQARAAMLLNVIRGPAWAQADRVETAHYVLRGDLPPSRLRAYAEHLEAARGVYGEVLGKAAPGGRRADVLLFNAQEGYHAYMAFTAGDRQEHSLGVFSPWHGQMALFEGEESAETLSVLAHEGFHQYLHALAPDVPIWFNEGMAEYAGATKIEKGTVVARGGLQEGRLSNLKAALRAGWTPVPFAELMRQSQAEFYGEWAPLKYAQAWSMIHYFFHGENGARQELMNAYTARVLAGDSAAAAFDATFAKEDLPTLEAAWRTHHALPAPAPTAPPPPPGVAAAAPPPIDLIKRLQENKTPLHPPWRMNGDVLTVLDRGRGTTLYLPYEVRGGYVWTLRVRREGVGGPLRLGLSWDGVPFVLAIDRESNAQLENVDGRWGSPERALLRAGQEHTLVCAVNKDGVSFSLDGAPVLRFPGPARRLSLPPQYSPNALRALFIDPGICGFSFSSLVVAPEAVEAPPAPLAGAPPEALKSKLASAVEADRVDALNRLGSHWGKEARELIAGRLDDPSAAVREAAADALARQRHPWAVEALGKALRDQSKESALTPALIRALGETEMCASVPHLLKALEAWQGRHFAAAITALTRVGCLEACPGLASLHRRADERLRMAVANRAPLPAAQQASLGQITAQTQQLLFSLTRQRPRRQGETWSAFVARGAHKPKGPSLRLCGATGRTFETPDDKAGACPHAPPGPEHEDVFLRHLPD